MKGDVHFGHDGWLFASDAVEAFASERFGEGLERLWVERIAARTRACTELGARYVHMPVPDRATLLATRHGMLPDEDGGPPGPLARLARRADELPALLNLHATFDGATCESAYPRSGSLWSFAGCHGAYLALCERLGAAPNRHLPIYPHRDEGQQLDLGARCSPPLTETVRRYERRLHSRLRYANHEAHVCMSRAEVVTSAAPADLDGCHAVHENDHPDAVRRCLLVFGDAFAGCGLEGLVGLLAETFVEVHVIGGEGVDPAQVARIRPDAVVDCRAERVLLRPPPDETAPVFGDERLRVVDAPPVPSGIGDVVREELLGIETYALDPPVTVQEEARARARDTRMTTNRVTLLEARDARVLFTGDKWMVNGANGEELLRWNVDDERAAASLAARPKRLRGTTMILAASAGASCYYHWMLEILPRLALLERRGTPLASIDRFLVRRIVGDWQLDTLARLGIRRSRVFETERRPNLACERVLHVELACGINLKMPRFVPLWARHAFAAEAIDGPRTRLYVGRPPGVRRGVSNEAAMRPLLEAAGFEIVVMEGRTVAEQAALLARADVVIAPHGGALTNMIFCRPGTKVVELLSRHVYPYYYGLAAMCGHRYHAILENPAEDYPRLVSHATAQSFGDAEIQRRTARLPFEVPLDALERMLARL